MNQDIYFEKLERYLDGELPEEERKAFETQLQTDEKLKEELAFHQMARQAVEVNIENELRAELNTWKAKEQNNGMKVVRFRRRALSIAAAVLLLVVAGWLVLFRGNSTEQLFNQQFTAFEDNISTQIDLELSEAGFGKEDGYLAVLEDAMQAYNQKNYEKAIPLFEEFNEKGAENWKDQSRFYQAMALIGNEQTAEALPVLEDLQTTSTFPDKATIQWYLALVYVKMDEKEAAREILNKLKEDEAYGDSSIKLLEKL